MNINRNIRIQILAMALLSLISVCQAQKITIDKNKPERKEWFQNLGFGMFIHWSIDVQLGAIISHNVAVGSKDYQDRYFNELPKTFNPKRFDPEEWGWLPLEGGLQIQSGHSAKQKNMTWSAKVTIR